MCFFSTCTFDTCYKLAPLESSGAGFLVSQGGGDPQVEMVSVYI